MSIPFLGIDADGIVAEVQYAILVVLHESDVYPLEYKGQVVRLHAYPGEWILRQTPPLNRPVMVWASPADESADEFAQKDSTWRKPS